MNYLAILTTEDDGFCVIVPEFVNGGILVGEDSREEALKMASEALALYLLEVGNPAPKYSKFEDVPAAVLEDMAAPEVVWLEPAPMNPVSLEVARLIEKSDMTLTAIAKAMKTSVPALIRMKDPFYWGHSLKTLTALGEATGAALEVRYKQPRGATRGGLRNSANSVQ